MGMVPMRTHVRRGKDLHVATTLSRYTGRKTIFDRHDILETRASSGKGIAASSVLSQSSVRRERRSTGPVLGVAMPMGSKSQTRSNVPST